MSRSGDHQRHGTRGDVFGVTSSTCGKRVERKTQYLIKDKSRKLAMPFEGSGEGKAASRALTCFVI